MTPASFGILDLRAVPHEARGADDAERARQARADDEHHDRADDGEDDLRLDDRRLPPRRAAPARAQRQHARQPRRDRQPRERVLQLLELRGHVRRVGEHVAAFAFFARILVDVLDCL